MKRTTVLMILCLIGTTAKAQISRQIFDFEFEGVLLNGVLNLPEAQEPKGIVLLVHGSGETNAVAQEWYLDIRKTFVKAGYGMYMWDKMGCGKSEGTFNYNQSVHNSASEAIAAINTLKEKKIPGSDHIGLYGGSRASWINPIVISQYKDIKFWISVSGVDDKENFGYLLEQNLRIDGVAEDSIKLFVEEWKAAVKIHHAGGSFESAQHATSNLRKNAFWRRFNGSPMTEEDYYNYQKTFMKEELDEETGLQVVVKDFESILTNINCPVLALFGERDMNVDWKKTKALYEKTLAQHTDLAIKSFPNCNHNILTCETGGFYEFQDNDLAYKRCNGFLEAINEWLNER
ncbi:MAG: alpha/beta hydrolase [Bacteroidota bacterium]